MHTRFLFVCASFVTAMTFLFGAANVWAAKSGGGGGKGHSGGRAGGNVRAGASAHARGGPGRVGAAGHRAAGVVRNPAMHAGRGPARSPVSVYRNSPVQKGGNPGVARGHGEPGRGGWDRTVAGKPWIPGRNDGDWGGKGKGTYRDWDRQHGPSWNRGGKGKWAHHEWDRYWDRHHDFKGRNWHNHHFPLVFDLWPSWYYRYPYSYAYSYVYDLYPYDSYAVPHAAYGYAAPYADDTYVYNYYTDYSYPDYQHSPAYQESEALSAEGPPPVGAPADSLDISDSVEVSGGQQLLDDARSAFLQGDYDNTVRLTNHAAIESPREAPVYELMSLALFALRDYQGAATAAHAALAMASPADWATIYNYYGDVQKYTAQFRALERYVRDNPRAAPARFLLGYHYGIVGAREQARREFEAAAKLTPDDRLLGALLQKFGGSPPTAPPPEPASQAVEF